MKGIDDFGRRFLAMQKLRNDLIKERESLYISDDINDMGADTLKSRSAFIEGEIIKGLLEGHKLIIVGEPNINFITEKQYSLADLARPPIHNGLETILIFKDGTKSIVKCSQGDLDGGKYNRSAGVAMALIKAQCGSDHKAYAESLRILCKEGK